MFLFGAGWRNSYHHWNSFAVHWKIASIYCGFGIKSEGGFIRIWGGRPYQGLFLRDWTGFRTYQSPSGDLNGPSLSRGRDQTLFIDWEAGDRPAIQCRFWVLSLVYSGAVTTALIWRQRKKRLYKLRLQALQSNVPKCPVDSAS